jgi:hypothetical protein
MFMQSLTRILILLIAIVAAVGITKYITVPYFEKKCLLIGQEQGINQKCIKSVYRQRENSVLINILPTNYWIWYNGRYVYLYGENTGRKCSRGDSEPVYVLDIKENKIVGYECVMKLEDVKKYYVGEEDQYMFYHNTFGGVFETINQFIEQGIIY